MKIEIKQKYKSLNPFISEELNGLTVITGKNGSGKTQLLELISKINEYRNNGNGRKNLELEPALKNIQVEGITKLDTNSITLEWWKELIKKRIEIFNKIPRDYLTMRIMG